MKKHKWIYRLLTGVLCVSLVLPSLSVSVYASEVNTEEKMSITQEEMLLEESNTVKISAENESAQIAEMTETAQTTETEEEKSCTEVVTEQETVTEEVMQMSSSDSDTVEEQTNVEEAETEEGNTEEDSGQEKVEDESTEQVETEVQTEIDIVCMEVQNLTNMALENENGFSNVKIGFYGFEILIEKGMFYYEEVKKNQSVEIYLVQYDKNDNRICSSRINWNNDSVEGQAYTYDVQSNVSSMPMTQNTALVRLEANVGEEVFYSDCVTITKVPEFDVEIVEVEPGIESLYVTVGNLQTMNQCKTSHQLYMELMYGTTTDESDWAITEKNCYIETQKEETIVVFPEIESDIIYHGKIRLFIQLYDARKEENVICFEKIISLDDFRVKAGKTYDLKEVFPDVVFREKIKEQLGLKHSEVDMVTTEQLLKISYLNIYRYSLNEEPIRDITGIELLSNLKGINIHNHEIESIEHIDWKNLKCLEWISLKGNNITTIPNLTQNVSLRSVVLDENLISYEELNTIYKKLPTACNLGGNTKYSQRLNGFQITAEKKYYVYESGVPVYFMLSGYKSGMMREDIYLDGEWVYAYSCSDNMVYSIQNTGLSQGVHTLKVELYSGTVKQEEAEIKFEVVDENSAFVKEKYYCSGVEEYLNWTVYFDTAKELYWASVVDENGDVYAEIEVKPTGCYNTREVRYQLLDEKIYDNVLYGENIILYWNRNVTPKGKYNLSLTYVDGTTEIIDDVVEVVGSDQMIIISSDTAWDYDLSGDCIYVYLRGNNINPEKLEYKVECNGILLETLYTEECKQVSNGVIVKLKKESGWDACTYWNAQITVSVKDGYICYPKQIVGSIWVDTNVYYTAYNSRTRKLEAGFSKGINCEGKSVTVEIREQSNENGPALATGDAIITDGMAYFNLKCPDGTEFKPSGNYIFSYKIGTITYEKWTYAFLHENVQDANVTTSITGPYWYGPSQYIQYGEKNVTYMYFTGCVYDDEASDASAYSVVLRNEELDIHRNGKIEVSQVSGYAHVRVTFDISKLQIGQYIIELYKGEDKLGEKFVQIVENDKFYINYMSMSWIFGSKLALLINTPKVFEEDSYEVILTDVQGNEVQGITTEIFSQVEGTLGIFLRGIKYEEAQKKYYVKIRSKKYGEPYNLDGTKYFSDSRGILQWASIPQYSFFESTNSGGVMGYSTSEEALPAILRIYQPGDTTVIREIQIDTTPYAFSKEFYESLPNPDGLYDLVVINKKGEIIVCPETLIHYLNSEALTFNYTIDRTEFFINKDEEKTATIYVTGAKENPKFKVADASVATISVPKNNPTKAVITAVGVGVTEIEISADGITKKVTICVDRKIETEGLVLNQTSLSMETDSMQELTATVVPADAWSEEQHITFTSSNEDVVAIVPEVAVMSAGIEARPYVEGNNKASIYAVGNGTAIITATLDGTEFTATCEVKVTGIYSEEEQNELVNAVGIKYILLNAYKNNVATLKDVKLPDGWSWEDSSIKLVADNDAPIQYYMATYREKGYQPFSALLPIAVARVNKIAVVGNPTLVSGKQDTFTVECQYIGYQAINEFNHYFDITWSVQGNKPVIGLLQTGKKTTKIQADNVTKNTTQTVNVVLTVNKDTRQIFRNTFRLTVLPKPYVDMVTITPAEEQELTKVAYVYDEQNALIDIDLQDISTVRNAVSNTVTLGGTASADGEATATKMRWTSSDTSVATVKMSKDTRSAVITVRKAGTAVITAMANDGGKKSQDIVIQVKDYAPVMESNRLNLELYQTQGVVLPLKEMNGNAITDVEVLEKNEVSSRFEVVKADEEFVLKLSEKTDITKRMTVKAVLRIVTEHGVYEDSKKQTVTINVNTTKPSASLKLVTRANIFYTDAQAVYAINSKYAISDIEDVTGSTKIRFHATYDAHKGTVIFHTDGTLTSDTLQTFRNRKTGACNLVLKVKYAGYTEQADQLIKVSVVTEERKPTWKINDLNLVPGMTEGTVDVYDTKEKRNVGLTEEESVKIISDTSKTDNVIATRSGGKINISYRGDKTATYKAQIDSMNWTQELVLSGKVTVAKDQILVLDTTKITLNTATDIQNNGTMTIGVSVKNHDAKVENVSFQMDKRNEKLILNDYVSILFNTDTQKIHVGLNKGKRGDIKAGTYTVTLGGTIALGEQKINLKSTKLTIVLVDRAPTVSLSAKGSIDLVQRQNTSIVYTPRLTNVTGIVKKVRLEGSYADYFEASVKDGAVVIKATNYPMSTKITYPVKVVMTLDNKMEVSTTVKIRPVCKLPRVTAGVTKATFYKAGKLSATYGLTTNVADAKIDKVCLVTDKNSQYFDFVYDDETQKITVSLSKKAKKMKTGNYTVSYQVYFEGMAYNVKPVTVRLTVSIK